jgi:uncharacterized membrane protein
MEARAKLFGHPIHQMLIVLPLGLFAAAVIFDVMNMITASNRWAETAFWCITIGVLGGLFAAVFGAVDWMGIPKGTRAKTVGAVHGVGNVVVVGLFIVSALLRNSAMPFVSTGGVVFAFAGAGLALFTGWLGGELVNRMGVGIHEGANVNATSSMTRRAAASTQRGAVPGRDVREGEETVIVAVDRTTSVTTSSTIPPSARGA